MLVPAWKTFLQIFHRITALKNIATLQENTFTGKMFLLYILQLYILLYNLTSYN